PSRPQSPQRPLSSLMRPARSSIPGRGKSLWNPLTASRTVSPSYVPNLSAFASGFPSPPPPGQNPLEIGSSPPVRNQAVAESGPYAFGWASTDDFAQPRRSVVRSEGWI